MPEVFSVYNYGTSYNRQNLDETIADLARRSAGANICMPSVPLRLSKARSHNGEIRPFRGLSALSTEGSANGMFIAGRLRTPPDGRLR